MRNKWRNYFGNIENKYNLKMNDKSPMVIFMDGKGITKSLKHNLISERKDSFNDILEQTIKYLTKKFECIAISGVDEVSFIFEDSNKIKELIPKKKYKAHEIISIFSQLFFEYFNERYPNSPVYWHCKCSNIPKGKIKSYIKYRSLTIYELNLTYLLKRKQFKDAGKISLKEKEKLLCDKIQNNQQTHKKGKLYINGQQVELEAFLNNEIIKIPEIIRENMETFLDINDF